MSRPTVLRGVTIVDTLMDPWRRTWMSPWTRAGSCALHRAPRSKTAQSPQYVARSSGSRRVIAGRSRLSDRRRTRRRFRSASSGGTLPVDPSAQGAGRRIPPAVRSASSRARLLGRPAAATASLRVRGAELVGQVERYKDSYRLCYVRGPEGMIVELAEQVG
jgi:hypothetical protein